MSSKKSVTAFTPGFWSEFTNKPMGPKTICRLAYEKLLRLRRGK